MNERNEFTDLTLRLTTEFYDKITDEKEVLAMLERDPIIGKEEMSAEKDILDASIRLTTKFFDQLADDKEVLALLESNPLTGMMVPYLCAANMIIASMDLKVSVALVEPMVAVVIEGCLDNLEDVIQTTRKDFRERMNAVT